MFCPVAIPTYLGRAEEGTVLTFYTRVDIANNNQLSTSAFKVRHLFTGQQWYPELGLFMTCATASTPPDLGRFLQTDPIGFSGDAGNLYRYCGNNAVTRSDPNGEAIQNLKAEGGDYTRGDALDYGYWGSDGTATISFGPLGVPTFDWTGEELGVLQTEEYYASYNVPYSYAMALNGYTSIGGIVVGQPILKATDARTGLYANGSRPGSANLGALGGPLGQLIGGVADILGKR